MWQAYNWAMRSMNGMGTWEWFAVLVAVLVVGLFCMKGFGSPSSY